MQKCREGLLRHLLHSALLSLPPCADGEDLELAKRICGTRRLLSNFQRAWTYDELFEMLSRLTALPDAKFFFLIDALDECEPQDRLGELADEVIRISQLPDVKLCVSCRPWSVFEQRFNEAQVLHLDRLTYTDMEIYIRGRLTSVGGDHELCSEIRIFPMTERATEFVNSIARAAEGVFLWVELVVKALASELRKDTCDELKDLERVLDEFPVGLDEYFQNLIFDRITKTRRNVSDTAAALLLALKIVESTHIEHVAYGLPSPHSFLNFWLLSRGYLEPGLSWTNLENKWYSPEDARRMVRQTTNFLEETCKDLLVVVPNSESEIKWDVDFFHRTVADFLFDDRVKLILEQQSPDHFSYELFLIDLGKMRCMCLFRNVSERCDIAEVYLVEIVDWSTTVSRRDKDWLLSCQALMIERHRKWCDCLEHLTDFLERRLDDCAALGLTEYLREIIDTWPHLAVQVSLYDLLSGYLAFAITAPHAACHRQLSLHGLRTISSAMTGMLSGRRKSVDLQGCLTASCNDPFASKSDDCHTRLLTRLLDSGANPNRQTTHFPKCPGSSIRPTIWQAWLRNVFWELKEHEQEDYVCKQLYGSRRLTRDVERVVSDEKGKITMM